MGILVNYTCKSFIKLTPGSDAIIQTTLTPINVPALKDVIKFLLTRFLAELKRYL